MTGLRGSRIAAALAALCFLFFAAEAQYQSPPPESGPPPGYQPPPSGSQVPPPSPAPATPQQLDDLVAPIALYPDPLLGEVLAASTYPMEIAEAEQWVRDHAKWKPSKLMDEAKKQNWDPSVQGLVAFPQVLKLLSQDMGWTTQLGNEFLAGQQQVMAAVQRMRAQAEAKGTLRSTTQETVDTQEQDGRQAITIEPANADIWYVPAYNPVYVWGPPVWGYYPPLLYPGIGIGFDWGIGIDLGLYFGGWGGWGWGGWGWEPDWYVGGIYLNGSFFHRYGFRDFHGAGALGRSPWVHDPAHRLGVPYSNGAVAGRYGAASGFDRGNFGGRETLGARGGGRSALGSPGFEQRSWTSKHSVFGGYHNGSATRMQSDHGFSSMGAGRTGGFHGGGFGGGFHGGGGGRR
jgi:hypothetical protein